MAEENSKEAYKDLQADLGDKQKRVYEYIRNHPNVTYNDVCRGLNGRTNTITARIKELRDLGLVVKSGDRIDPITKKSCATYKVREDEPPEDNKKFAHPIHIEERHKITLQAIMDKSLSLFNSGFSSLDTTTIATPDGPLIMLVAQGKDYAIMTTADRRFNSIVWKDLDLTVSSIRQVGIFDEQNFAIVHTGSTRVKVWIE